MDLLLGSKGPNRNPESWMTRMIRSLVVGGSLVAALFLTVFEAGDKGGVGLVGQKTSSAAPDRDKKDYDLSALNVFRRVLLRITDNYVEPERIRPDQMLLAALHAIERNVAEVLFEEVDDKSKVIVRVQDVQRAFSIKHVDSPWTLSSVMRDILRFIQPQLNPETDIREVEYAAINGMLSTLDPHSVLLQPDFYNEMKLSTRGQFGGLGIVISMIQGVLTVMNPMKGTPAHEQGLKSCDKILKIGEESTVNMTLTQAVQRLRGAPGSTVTITISRAGWSRPVRKTLRRAVIKVDSVTSRMLARRIGYVRLRSFQGNSYDDLQTSLKDLRRRGMRGLVLDLRGNPGGLLDQAIKISDLFIDSGTLVATVSHAGRKREEKRATREGTEDRYPIVVLVSSGSASASEIVAGALKHLDRGVVLGRRTFGKGSVQVLYDNDDGSALKLTIAQYLTPGDISIQSVGITPDVATAPVLVREEFIRLRRRDNHPRENDLRKHLTNSTAQERKAKQTLRYLAKVNEEDEEDQDENHSGNLCLYPDRRCKPTDEDRFTEDFQIRLARDLLAQAKGWRRSQILAGAGSLFSKVQSAEDKRIQDALRKLGVDWTRVPPEPTALAANAVSPAQLPAGQKPKLDVVVTTDPSGQPRACQQMKLKVTVTNRSQTTVSRLAGVTESTNRALAHHELVFGKLAPGATRSWTVPIKLRDIPTRVDSLTVKLYDGNDNEYPPHKVRISVRGIERPVFAYGYQLIDDVKGNGDGRAQLGEQVRLLVNVRNTGLGAAFRTVTTLKNLSGVGIFIRKGRFVFGRLEPGESKTESFTFEVQPGYEGESFKLELAVYDDGLQEAVSEKLKFEVAKSAHEVAAASGRAKVKVARGTLRAWPSASAPPVGYASRGTVFELEGSTGEWLKVLASAGRPAFVATSEVKTGGFARSKRRFDPVLQVTPPKIALEVPTHATEAEKIRIEGRATDDTRVSDLYIFVRNPEAKIFGRKVFYRSNRRSSNRKQLRFAANVPLWKGANYVTVFAREDQEVQANQMVVIYRHENGSGH
jgi:carboxyl-terminal processing protease